MNDIQELIEQIKKLPRNQKTLLIAIDGRGGSGKSTLAKKLSEKIEKATIVHLDDFAYPQTDRQRLLEQVILPLTADMPARYQRFDWPTQQLAEWHEILPGGVVIIEGVSTLHDMLNQHYDYRIWIECSPEVGFARGLKRDKEVYGVDTTEDWITNWLPEEKQYVEQQQPQEQADFILESEQ